jgi:hypothetical protein
VAEGEGAQEGAEGGGRHRLVAEQRLAGAGAQHVCVFDRVRAGGDRVDQREYLAPGPGGAGAFPQSHRLIDQGLDAQAPAQGGEKNRHYRDG